MNAGHDMIGPLLLAVLGVAAAPDAAAPDAAAPGAAAAAASPAPSPSATSPTLYQCDILQYDNVSVSERWVSVEGERRSVVVEWSGEAERAAGALLAAALRLAGYSSTRLRRDARSLPDRSFAADYARSEVVVVVAARWTPGDVWADWLQAVGAPVVPLSPRLHRRCRSPSPCCLLPTDKLYVVDEWVKYINVTHFNESNIHKIDRRKLAKWIRSDGDDSEPQEFTFIDVEVWGDEPTVEVLGPAPVASGVSTRALSVADGALRRYSPALWHLLSKFEPRVADLRHLLTLDRAREDPVLDVCKRAAISPHLLGQLHTWASYIDSKRYKHHVYVFLCTEAGAGGPENDSIDEYVYLLKRLEKILVLKKLHVTFDRIIVNCDDDGGATENITRLFRSQLLYRTIGAVGHGRIFGEVTSIAESKRLTLMSYSAVEYRTVGAAGGRPGSVARAVRELLAACRWRRLAVLSERDRAATDLSAALTAANDLNLKDVSVVSNRSAIRDVLQTLESSDARIFLVNAGAGLAGEVMSVAAELGLTPHSGRVWLTREWVGAGGGAGPYELTFAWRGGDQEQRAGGAAAAAAARLPLWDELQERWRRRGSWPLYAAPLADALLALGNGYDHIFQLRENFYDDVHSDDAFRTFWNLTETEVISPGVVQQLRLKDRELSSPRVFLYRWNGSRTSLVGEWRLGDGTACPLPEPVPRDGSQRCFVPVGDRFDPGCGEPWLIAGVVALMVLVPMLLMAAKAARRAMLARDAHLVKRAEEMLEARWRAKASRLEPYFVKRQSLKLREQIGAGRFGRVWLGFLREPARPTEVAVVAAKALREDAAPVEETEFFREARALASLQHEHIVRFVGVCVTDGPPLLLMEYAFFGDLLRYLRARRHLVATGSFEAEQVSAEALTRFARQAADALAYLARRGFVHRDLRAANCLVDETRSLKLADFGMARSTRSTDRASRGDGDGDVDGEYTSRRRALFPVLWMAPESLSRGVFSAASDVWALGVLALELVTLGARPYGTLSPLQVHHYVVTKDGRPPLPRELGVEARDALLACWRRAPTERPAAAALAAWLSARPRVFEPVLRATTEDPRPTRAPARARACAPVAASLVALLLFR